VSRLSYPADRSDPAWSRVRPHIVPARLRGRPGPEQRWREYLDAILSVVRTGCPWRALPHDFAVHWSSAHKHFLRASAADQCAISTWRPWATPEAEGAIQGP